ncbi:unnamed protein product [Allacma fusca]|uniref:Uncharacterized protein n=1 Tax=Allacma fusca TaxID=39272 RepID=A0A8J2KTV3_9HEXA|nr:unnamed protein product [Allacma fusca]
MTDFVASHFNWKGVVRKNQPSKVGLKKHRFLVHLIRKTQKGARDLKFPQLFSSQLLGTWNVDSILEVILSCNIPIPEELFNEGESLAALVNPERCHLNKKNFRPILRFEKKRIQNLPEILISILNWILKLKHAWRFDSNSAVEALNGLAAHVGIIQRFQGNSFISV